MNNLYEVLGLDPSALPADIVRAYRQRAKATHPDHNDPAKTAEFHAVQHAYEVLSDPGRRAKYDADGATGEPSALEAKAMTALTALVMELVDRTEQQDFDVVGTAKQEICNRHIALSGQAQDMVRKAAHYRKKARKFKSKQAAENVFQVILERRAQDCEGQAAAIKEGMAVCDVMLELLNGYSYKADQAPDRSYPGTWGQTTGTTFFG